jgi:hypothetical protein
LDKIPKIIIVRPSKNVNDSSNDKPGICQYRQMPGFIGGFCGPTKCWQEGRLWAQKEGLIKNNLLL